VQANSWLRGQGGAVGGSWIGDDDRVGLGAVRYESKYGIPAEDTYIDMHQTKLLMRSSFGLGEGVWRNLTVDGGWADYAHSERDETGEALSTFKDKEWDVRAEAVTGAWSFLSESALGVQLQKRDFSALGEGEEFLLPTTTGSRAVFGFAEAPLGTKLRLQFGARVESVDVDGTSPDDVATSRSFTPVSGSAGLVMDLGEAWRLGLSLSSASRAPAQVELFARGAHDGPRTFETGDPTLGEERANSAEVSLRWRGGRVHADGSLWVTQFDDYIHGELTGRTCDEEGNCFDGDVEELQEMFYAQQDARFRGAEAHAEIELMQHAAGDLHLDLMADVVRATFDGGGNVPRIPPWHAGAGVSWQSEMFDAGVSAKYSARQSDTGVNETVTEDYVSVDAQLAWRPWSRNRGIELALVGRNLTDSVQRNAVSLNKDEVLLPGRDIRLMFRAQFD
jgi:iron complex outermembrane receptor protein